MAASKRLIVGLGNIGAEYDQTRHNIGFDVVDAISKRARISMNENRHNAIFGWGKWRGNPLGLAKPTTFMNLSGNAVRALIRKYVLSPKDILVISDDVNLPPAEVRIRASGGAGGHNGLKDIIDQLGTDSFPRLRFGVGANYSRGQQVAYVLSSFETNEREDVEDAIKMAVDASLCFVTDGLQTTMNRYNKRRKVVKTTQENHQE